jgi:undecaprenyl-diphosphatase
MSRAAELILSLHGWVALSVVFLVPALEASAFVGILFPSEIAVILGACSPSRAASVWPPRSALR